MANGPGDDRYFSEPQKITMDSDQIAALLKEEKSSNRIWFYYLPYWPLFLLLVVLMLAGAWFYLRSTAPVFESNATIIVKDNKRGTEDAKMIGELNQLAAPTIVENEMEVLKSRTLMGEVVNNLGLYAPVFAEGKFHRLSAYASSPLKVEVQSPDSLTEVTKVPLLYDEKENKAVVNGTAYSLNQWVATPYGTLRFSRNNTKNPAEGPFYFALVDPKILALDLLGKLDVSSNKLSSVVSLKMQDEVPRRSENILNELIRVYNLANINDKNVLAANTLGFVEERLRYVSKDLDSIERKLQQYKSRQGAVDISTQGKLFLENVSSNDQKLNDVNMQLAVLNQVKTYVQSKQSQSGIVPSTLGVSDPMLSQLVTKLYATEQEYDGLKKTTGENLPSMMATASQIEKMRASILENVNSQVQGLMANRTTIYATNSAYNSLLQALPQQERSIVEISREHTNKTAIYNYLLQKREEAALSHSVTADTRLIDKAQSSLQPVSPKRKVIYLLAVMLAFGLGIALVSVRRLFNRKVMFRHEIEAVTSFPILGEIGFNRSASRMITQKGKTNFVAEQFRKLRTSLDYIGINGRRKRILVTSTTSGEGKSFVTVNLGLSLAMTGKKVVIVEFDLSNPSLTAKLNYRRGLTDYLAGKAEPEEIIKTVDEHENLFLIPAGVLPDDAYDLLLNHRIAELFAYLQNLFDYILVDSAPVGLMSDGYVLSKHCDATLYIVRHNYTPKVMLERLDDNNKINELKNLAIVFNGLNARGLGKAYGYGYGYGYGYVAKTKASKKGSRSF